jgi:hypothetical protein
MQLYIEPVAAELGISHRGVMRRSQGTPRTDKMIDASVQWAERIMRRIDATGGKIE